MPQGGQVISSLKLSIGFRDLEALVDSEQELFSDGDRPLSLLVVGMGREIDVETVYRSKGQVSRWAFKRMQTVPLLDRRKGE